MKSTAMSINVSGVVAADIYKINRTTNSDERKESAELANLLVPLLLFYGSVLGVRNAKWY